jgi:hypothetical protein
MEMAEKQKGYVKAEYPRSEITGRIIAAANQVYNYLGPGCEEVIYQPALALSQERNRKQVKVDWQFRTDDACIKRKALFSSRSE